MEWNEIWKIVLGITSSIGGIGLIILGLSKYIGKIFADKYIEKIKKNFEKEVEDYKTELDIHKTITLRYSNAQFEQYSILLASLYDLKTSADKLWDSASDGNLVIFSKQLKNTKIQIEKAGLFIEDSDYENLMKILNHFLDYKIGKGKLIRYKRGTYLDLDEIQRLVNVNRKRKASYDNLIIKIKNDLRNQIRGKN